MLHNLITALDVHPAHPIDRLGHASMGRTVAPVSPASLGLAFTDWALHLQMYPTRQAEMALKGMNQWLRLTRWGAQKISRQDNSPCITPDESDRRFNDEEWQRWPFCLYQQAFLLSQQWWQEAVEDVRGVDVHHENVVKFVTRQILDMASPSNYIMTNPKVLSTTIAESGSNLRRGFEQFQDDMQRSMEGKPPRGTEDYPVGERLAITPGKVVFRNRLIELIQYTPSTKQVHPEPVLFIPAWIMKYYILDLEQDDSLVKYMVDQGFTVFMISWRNPGPEDRDIDFDDYRQDGIMSALRAVNAIVPDQKVHAVGYCIGGTLTMIAAAHMARVEDNRLATLTLFAAQADFSDPGELGLFIDPSQVAYLEDMMWERGYLGGQRMRGAFFFLRSLDMIWSRHVSEYLLGKPRRMFDLMAWNADTTNLPYRMHSQYLRRFQMNNDLVEGRYEVDDEPVMLMDIRVPIFTVGAERDHIAPWRAVYKINRLTRADTTFLLTKGGHNVGVVNPPGRSRYAYQVNTSRMDDKYMSPDAFKERIPLTQGSWWPEWKDWLVKHSGKAVSPPSVGSREAGYPPLHDAPGTYIYQSARMA